MRALTSFLVMGLALKLHTAPVPPLRIALPLDLAGTYDSRAGRLRSADVAYRVRRDVLAFFSIELHCGVVMRKLSASLGLFLVVLLTGCSTGTVSNVATGTLGSLAVQSPQGVVHGGQQAITGANVQLWEVGTTGYGSAPAPRPHHPG